MAWNIAIYRRYTAALEDAEAANALANSMTGPSPADTAAALELCIEAADEVVAAATAEAHQYPPMHRDNLAALAMLDTYREIAARQRRARATWSE